MKKIQIAAHRGVSGANIPCNTPQAYQIALMQGADIVELDVAPSADGALFVFHPGMEKPHLGCAKPIAQMSAAEVSGLRYLNQDDVPTHYGVARLDDVLELLKGRCVVNVDKFWHAPQAIADTIRRHGMADQVIIKTPEKPEYFDAVERFAPEMAFMPVIRYRDSCTELLRQRALRCIGAEVLFEHDSDPVACPEYLEAMHQAGMLVWVNAIVYDERAVISAGHTDDRALAGDPEGGWGVLADRGFDMIQTDWCAMLRNYLQEREERLR